jgi:aconitate hydratase 2/2-methylisocitrate dehydratase
VRPDQPCKATELLGTMLGGYNVSPLIDLLDDAAVAATAAEALKKTLLMFDQFHDVKEKADKGNATPRPCCRAGPTPSGSPAAPKCPEASPSPSSR